MQFRVYDFCVKLALDLQHWIAALDLQQNNFAIVATANHLQQTFSAVLQIYCCNLLLQFTAAIYCCNLLLQIQCQFHTNFHDFFSLCNGFGVIGIFILRVNFTIHC
jgi:hypothetical protein